MSGPYRTIVADPPWPGDWFPHSPGGRRRNWTPQPYGLMTLDEIVALPVGGLAASDANLFLWVPPQLNREGIGVKVARAWGFEPASEIVWAKNNLGMGRFPRLSHEILLVCSRGDYTLTGPLDVHSVQRWRQFYGNKGGKSHSVKPEGAIDLIEMHSPGPYVELFARRHRFNWDVWGEESANTVHLEATR